MSGNSKLRASVLIDLVDRFSAGARKMAGLSDKLGRGLAGAQAELKRLQAQAGRLDQLRALQSRLGKTAADMAAAKKRAAGAPSTARWSIVSESAMWGTWCTPRASPCSS